MLLFETLLEYFFLPFRIIKHYIIRYIIKCFRNKKTTHYYRTNLNCNLFNNLKLLENPFLKTKRDANIVKNIISFILKKNVRKKIYSTSIYWPPRWNIFIYTNGLDFYHDFLIKCDLLINALKLPKNYCIIDCGAHIGDGAIPIAHALAYFGRSDIIVYAIEPSEYKCNFIKEIARINNIHNIKVLNYGLSNDINKYSLIYPEISTGGTRCGYLDINGINFVTIDYLCESIIDNKIGIIHLDIEGHEIKALQGASNTLNKYKPYLSLENFSDNKYNNLLPDDYYFKCKIGVNDVYSINENI